MSGTGEKWVNVTFRVYQIVKTHTILSMTRVVNLEIVYVADITGSCHL